MDNLLTVAQQVAVLFMLMGAGLAVRLAKLADDRTIDGCANILMMLVTPCVIIDSFQRPFDDKMLGGLAIAFGIAVAGHIVAIAMAHSMVRHGDEATRRPLMLATVFSNAGFMGLPLEQAIIGDAGVFYGVVYIVVFNLFMWTWGLRIMRSGGSGNIVRMAINPGTVGIAVGLPLFLLSAQMPRFIAAPVHHLAGMNTPLAMLVVGYSIAGARLGRVARMPTAYLTILLRLVVCPLVVIAVMYPFRAHLDRNMMLAVAIAAAAPVAAMVSMFAVKFRRDVDTSVAVVSASTLLSIVSLPVVIALAMSVL